MVQTAASHESIFIPHWEFRILFCMMRDKLIKHLQTKGAPAAAYNKDRKIIGYPIQEKEEYTKLYQHINEDAKVREFLIQFPNKPKKRDRATSGFLYKRLVELEKTNDPEAQMKLDGIYQFIFFIYLGFRDLEEFRNITRNKVPYTGLYYSPTKSRVCAFSFEIIVIGYPGRELFCHKVLAATKDFHDNINGIELEGDLVQLRECWTARVSKGEYFIDFTIYTQIILKDVNALIDYEQLFGSLTAISSDRLLVNMEFVVVKEPSNQGTLVDVKRYLYVKRNCGEIDIREVDMRSMKSIKTSETNVGDLAKLANKTYRILARGIGGQFIQSRFCIHEDYYATIEVPEVENGRPLDCKISFVANQRLLVFSYLGRFKLYTTTAIEFVPKLHHDSIIVGTFCVIDPALNEKLKGYKFVMAVDKNAFEIKRFAKDEFDQSDLLLGSLIEKLIDKS
jgi:hypothetical protein